MIWFNKSSKKKIFNECIEQHNDALYRHALWMIGNKATAFDMVQDTFYQAWISIDTLKDTGKSLAWLLTILRRAIYREQRHQYRQMEMLEQLSHLDDIEHENDSYQLLEIYSMLQGLSSSHRDVFLMHYLHGFSYEEISQELEVPIGTVMSRLSRARKELKKHQTYSDSNLVSINTFTRKNTGGEL